MADRSLVHEARTALKSNSVFAGLPEEAIGRLAVFARRESYDSPTLLVRGGEHVTALRYVVKGHMVARASREGGEAAELIPIYPGQFATWIGTFAHRPVLQDYWTSSRAEFIAFPNEKVLETADRFPMIYKVLLGEVAGRFQTVLKWVWNTNLSDGPARLGAQLLLYAAAAPDDSAVEILASQESLARALGLSRQTLNRQLQVLEAEGLVEISYRQIVITDRQALAAYAGQGEVPA
jgi:CRP-like cAMP-binding protein